jgi:hypothetical protein
MALNTDYPPPHPPHRNLHEIQSWTIGEGGPLTSMKAVTDREPGSVEYFYLWQVPESLSGLY